MRPTNRCENTVDGNGNMAPLKRNTKIENSNSNPLIWQSGDVTNAVISESVSLLRYLLCCDALARNTENSTNRDEGFRWKSFMADALKRSLMGVAVDGQNKLIMNVATQKKIMAVLFIMGGLREELRPGIGVRLVKKMPESEEYDGGEAVSPDSNIDGTCIAYERGKSEALVVLTECESTLSLSSSSNDSGGLSGQREIDHDDGMSAVPVRDLIAVSDVSVALVAKSFGLTDDVLQALLTVLKATETVAEDSDALILRLPYIKMTAMRVLHAYTRALPSISVPLLLAAPRALSVLLSLTGETSGTTQLRSANRENSRLHRVLLDMTASPPRSAQMVDCVSPEESLRSSKSTTQLMARDEAEGDDKNSEGSPTSEQSMEKSLPHFLYARSSASLPSKVGNVQMLPGCHIFDSRTVTFMYSDNKAGRYDPLGMQDGCHGVEIVVADRHVPTQSDVLEYYFEVVVERGAMAQRGSGKGGISVGLLGAEGIPSLTDVFRGPKRAGDNGSSSSSDSSGRDGAMAAPQRIERREAPRPISRRGGPSGGALSRGPPEGDGGLFSKPWAPPPGADGEAENMRRALELRHAMERERDRDRDRRKSRVKRASSKKKGRSKIVRDAVRVIGGSVVLCGPDGFPRKKRKEESTFSSWQRSDDRGARVPRSASAAAARDASSDSDALPTIGRTGDVIGVGWNRAKETVYFTFNGEKLATAFPLPADSLLVPAAFIGLNDRVRFNFGQEPFCYQGLAEIQLDEKTRERLEKEAEIQKKALLAQEEERKREAERLAAEKLAKELEQNEILDGVAGTFSAFSGANCTPSAPHRLTALRKIMRRKSWIKADQDVNMMVDWWFSGGSSELDAQIEADREEMRLREEAEKEKLATLQIAQEQAMIDGKESKDQAKDGATFGSPKKVSNMTAVDISAAGDCKAGTILSNEGTTSLREALNSERLTKEQKCLLKDSLSRARLPWCDMATCYDYAQPVGGKSVEDEEYASKTERWLGHVDKLLQSAVNQGNFPSAVKDGIMRALTENDEDALKAAMLSCDDIDLPDRPRREKVGRRTLEKVRARDLRPGELVYIVGPKGAESASDSLESLMQVYKSYERNGARPDSELIRKIRAMQSRRGMKDAVGGGRGSDEDENQRHTSLGGRRGKQSKAHSSAANDDANELWRKRSASMLSMEGRIGCVVCVDKDTEMAKVAVRDTQRSLLHTWWYADGFLRSVPETSARNLAINFEQIHVVKRVAAACDSQVCALLARDALLWLLKQSEDTTAVMHGEEQLQPRPDPGTDFGLNILECLTTDGVINLIASRASLKAMINLNFDPSLDNLLHRLCERSAGSGIIRTLYKSFSAFTERAMKDTELAVKVQISDAIEARVPIKLQLNAASKGMFVCFGDEWLKQILDIRLGEYGSSGPNADVNSTMDVYLTLYRDACCVDPIRSISCVPGRAAASATAKKASVATLAPVVVPSDCVWLRVEGKDAEAYLACRKNQNHGFDSPPLTVYAFPAPLSLTALLWTAQFILTSIERGVLTFDVSQTIGHLWRSLMSFLATRYCTTPHPLRAIILRLLSRITSKLDPEHMSASDLVIIRALAVRAADLHASEESTHVLICSNDKTHGGSSSTPPFFATKYLQSLIEFLVTLRLCVTEQFVDPLLGQAPPPPAAYSTAWERDKMSHNVDFSRSRGWICTKCTIRNDSVLTDSVGLVASSCKVCGEAVPRRYILAARKSERNKSLVLAAEEAQVASKGEAQSVNAEEEEDSDRITPQSSWNEIALGSSIDWPEWVDDMAATVGACSFLSGEQSLLRLTKRSTLLESERRPPKLLRAASVRMRSRQVSELPEALLQLAYADMLNEDNGADRRVLLLTGLPAPTSADTRRGTAEGTVAEASVAAMEPARIEMAETELRADLFEALCDAGINVVDGQDGIRLCRIPAALPEDSVGKPGEDPAAALHGHGEKVEDTNVKESKETHGDVKINRISASKGSSLSSLGVGYFALLRCCTVRNARESGNKILKVNLAVTSSGLREQTTLKVVPWLDFFNGKGDDFRNRKRVHAALLRAALESFTGVSFAALVNGGAAAFEGMTNAERGGDKEMLIRCIPGLCQQLRDGANARRQEKLEEESAEKRESEIAQMRQEDSNVPQQARVPVAESFESERVTNDSQEQDVESEDDNDLAMALAMSTSQPQKPHQQQGLNDDGADVGGGDVSASTPTSRALGAEFPLDATASPYEVPVTFSFGSMTPADVAALTGAPSPFESITPAESKSKFSTAPNVESAKSSEEVQLTAEEQLVLSLCACLREKRGYDVPWFSLNAHPSFAEARRAMSKRRWTWEDDVALVTYVDKLAQALDTPW